MHLYQVHRCKTFGLYSKRARLVEIVLAYVGCPSSPCGLQADVEGNGFFVVLPFQALQGRL